MPKYQIVLEMMVSMWVDAHNEEEAKEFILADTECQIGAGIDLIDGGGFVNSIEFDSVIKESQEEESFQCPNCDKWGYDVEKSFCSVCDAEEEAEEE